MRFAIQNPKSNRSIASKIIQKSWWSVAALALLGLAGSPSAAIATAPSASGVKYVSSANAGQVVVTGTSTLHAWSIKSGAMHGQAILRLPGAVKTTPMKGQAAPAAIETIDLSIPVASLKSRLPS